MFHLGTLLRTVDRETASQINVIQKGKRGPGYIGVFAVKEKKKKSSGYC